MACVAGFTWEKPWYDSLVERMVRLLARRIVVVLIVLAILSTVAALWHFPLLSMGGKVVVQISEDSILLVRSSGNKASVMRLASLGEDYAVVIEAHLPALNGDHSSYAILGKGFGRKALGIDTGKVFDAWARFLRAGGPKLPERLDITTLPAITVMIAVYTASGEEYLGSKVITIYDLLVAKGYSEEKAAKLVEENPARALELAKGTIVLKPEQLPVFRVNISRVINDAVRDAYQELGKTPPRPRAQLYQEPGWPGVYYEVYNPDLYKLRNNPPREWYEKIQLYNGKKAPASDVEKIWYTYADHFSKIFYYDKKRYTLSQALKHAFLAYSSGDAPKTGRAVLLRTMQEFVNHLARYAGLYKWYQWENTDIGVHRYDIPVLCVKAEYNRDNEYSKHVAFTLEYEYWGSKDIYEGLSLFGLLSITLEKTGRENWLPNPVSATYYDPYECFYVPSYVGQGVEGDLAITIVDVSSTRSFWVLKPAVIFIPHVDLYMNYLRAYSKKLSMDEEPAGSEEFLWGDDAFVELFNDNVGYNNTPFFVDKSVSTRWELRYFSGSALDYYFPAIATLLDSIGFINGVYETYSAFVEAARAAASTNPYATTAMLIVELAREAVQLTVHHAYESGLVLEVYGWGQAGLKGHLVHVYVSKRTIKYKADVAGGFNPTVTMYYALVGYNLPGGPYHPTQKSGTG